MHPIHDTNLHGQYKEIKNIIKAIFAKISVFANAVLSK